MSKLGLFGTVALSLVAVACGGAAPKVEDGAKARANAAPGTRSCARLQPGVGAVRADAVRQGSSVALARLGDTTLGYVADEDAHALRTVDVGRGKALASTPVDGSPAQVLVLADGRVAVTLRDRNRIEILEPAANPAAPLASLCAVDVPVEPFGLAATPDDARLLVTSVWDRTLTVLDAKTLRRSFEVQLPREPRAVLVDDDGQRAFVAHVVGGKLSVIDLASDKHEVRDVDLRVKRLAPAPPRRGGKDELRSSCQGFALAKAIDDSQAQKPRTDAEGRPVGEGPKISGRAPKDPAPARPKGRVFAPMVTVEPGDPNQRSSAYYGDVFDGVAKEAPIVSVIDTEAERSLTKNVLTLGNRMTEECVLPRSAAVRGSTGTLFVTCLGIDAMVELDTRGLDPARLERRRWGVPAGPTGVAIDDRDGRAVVWSQYEGKLSVIDLRASADRPSVKLVSMPGLADVQQLAFARGRRLFHTTEDKRISSDGTACASCHPDGREDALTWATPDGPRQTIMLAGRVEGSAPYGWMGKHDTLTNYVTNTFSRLGGTGLKDRDLDDLVTYVREMSGPVLPGSPSSERTQLVAHGRDLFFGESQGCASCHTGATATDSTHHDIGSKASADLITTFDTPSLRFIRGTAPYFHDGRYETLDDVLAANDVQMGHTGHLSRRDAVALKAYLESL